MKAFIKFLWCASRHRRFRQETYLNRMLGIDFYRIECKKCGVTDTETRIVEILE
jgi:hypothetical protein